MALHVLRNEVAKVDGTKGVSNMDKLAAYQRLLRGVSSLARRAAERLNGNDIYFAQRNDGENIRDIANHLQQGVVIAQREET